MFRNLLLFQGESFFHCVSFPKAGPWERVPGWVQRLRSSGRGWSGRVAALCPIPSSSDPISMTDSRALNSTDDNTGAQVACGHGWGWAGPGILPPIQLCASPQVACRARGMQPERHLPQWQPM